MTRQRLPQASAPAPQQRTGALDVPGQPRQVITPYLSAAEARVFLRLGSESALYRLVREHRLPTLRRGRLYLFDVRELEAWLRGASSALALLRQKRA